MFRLIRRFSTEVPKNKKIITVNTDVLRSFSENKICQPIYSLLSYNDGLIAQTETNKILNPKYEYPFYYMPNEANKKQIIEELNKYAGSSKNAPMNTVIGPKATRFSLYAAVAGFIFGILNSDKNYSEQVFIDGLGYSFCLGITAFPTYLAYSCFGPFMVIGCCGAVFGSRMLISHTTKKNRKNNGYYY